ncbi:HAL/PAL/TAL family ammonia-lyase [Paenibacillus sp. Root444D2]|uniref:HAL/PAL/TAL family ammonia-lyase n=2 Tax=unclassified Paenibacillus TaxID=185978 RepID=UPI00070CF849|nr:aromatic amino acid ammonia-lyase [Paenibacillus sp. Root444D2]KQX48923.1 phenylalanine ammonia-lyase [Paenibacillus sp. Root444D2]
MTNQLEYTLVLDGKSLTIEDLQAVAVHRVKVEIDESSWELLEKSRRFVLKKAELDEPVYGFNRGVGLNKDRIIEAQAFETYNRNLLYAHAAGIEPYASEEQVRAVLLARLNSLLVGRTGIAPAIAKQYADFLNAGIHPLLPLRGSVGAGDITLLSHLGLAFIGEGDVMYAGARTSAAAALAQAGLTPVRLGAKDGLAIVSSNAVAAGTGALVLYACEQLLELADLVYALSLEGLQGHVTPLDPSVQRYRPYAGQSSSAERVRRFLTNSGLWHKESASLQDPLSFRSACHIHGAALDGLQVVKAALHIHLNASDDNPCVLEEEDRIVSCANFEPLAWVLGFEMLGIALSHVSKSACFRTIKLGSPSFTGLSRFLSPDESTIAFSTIQKTFTALDAEIRHLSNPSSADYYSLAGDMEDHSSNAPFVVSKVGEIIDRLYYIVAIEAMHAVQAIDLRAGVKLGQGTQAAYDEFRTVVPFLAKDRNLTADIQSAYQLLKSGKLLTRVRQSFAM